MAIVFAISHCIVRVARVRVTIVQYGLTSISRGVLGWGRTLLEQADIYTELKERKRLGDPCFSAGGS